MNVEIGIGKSAPKCPRMGMGMELALQVFRQLARRLAHRYAGGLIRVDPMCQATVVGLGICHRRHVAVAILSQMRFVLAMRLLECWHCALSSGVCLNYLRDGHSSFAFLKEGSCNRCGIRHNGLLSRFHPANI